MVQRRSPSYTKKRGLTYTDPIEFGVVDNYDTPQNVAKALDWLNNLVGVPVTEDELKSGNFDEQLTPVSAALLVDENTVPVVFIHGERDVVVPFSQAERLHDALEANGVQHDFVRLDKSGHFTGWQSEGLITYLKLIEDYLARYMPVK